MKDKVKIIFDTDIGGDCDDAGALAMLHSLCNLGEAELVAVTACYASPYVAGCIDAINTYFKRKVPVGINYESKTQSEGVYAKALCTEFKNDYSPEDYLNGNGAEDSLVLLRKILAESEDNSITFVITGTMSTAARLVKSEPDDISPLSGVELIKKKIKRTYAMGGRFFETWPMPIIIESHYVVTKEWNIKGDIDSAKIMCDMWPGELVFSSYEIGLWCVSMRRYVDTAKKENPARRAYELHPRGRWGRESWDHTAMLAAVRPQYEYYHLHPWGKVSVDDEGVSIWKKSDKFKQSYLFPTVDYAEIVKIIDELVDEK